MHEWALFIFIYLKIKLDDILEYSKKFKRVKTGKKKKKKKENYL